VTLLDSYFPFDQPPGNMATPANWRQMARLFYGSGVVPGNQNQLAATISGGTVTIQPGAVWVDGFFGQSNSNKTVSGVSSGLVVARMDLTQRQIYFLYLPGTSTPGQNPLANTYDIPLYQVASASAMTDVRQWCNADPTKVARGRTHRNAAYNTSTTLYPYGFDTIDYGSNWSAYTFVCPYAADYLCLSQVGFDANAAGQWYNIRLVHNTTLQAWSGTPTSTGGAIMVVQIQDIVPCKAGDTLYIQHNCSTNGLAGRVGSYYAWFTVRALT